jgi:hypothetical protein
MMIVHIYMAESVVVLGYPISGIGTELICGAGLSLQGYCPEACYSMLPVVALHSGTVLQSTIHHVHPAKNSD